MFSIKGWWRRKGRPTTYLRTGYWRKYSWGKSDDKNTKHGTQSPNKAQMKKNFRSVAARNAVIRESLLVYSLILPYATSCYTAKILLHLCFVWALCAVLC